MRRLASLVHADGANWWQGEIIYFTWRAMRSCFMCNHKVLIKIAQKSKNYVFARSNRWCFSSHPIHSTLEWLRHFDRNFFFNLVLFVPFELHRIRMILECRHLHNERIQSFGKSLTGVWYPNSENCHWGWRSPMLRCIVIGNKSSCNI